MAWGVPRTTLRQRTHTGWLRKIHSCLRACELEGFVDGSEVKPVMAEDLPLWKGPPEARRNYTIRASGHRPGGGVGGDRPRRPRTLRQGDLKLYSTDPGPPARDYVTRMTSIVGGMMASMMMLMMATTTTATTTVTTVMTTTTSWTAWTRRSCTICRSCTSFVDQEWQAEKEEFSSLSFCSRTLSQVGAARLLMS